MAKPFIEDYTYFNNLSDSESDGEQVTVTRKDSAGIDVAPSPSDKQQPSPEIAVQQPEPDVTAAEKVFATYELVEQILLHLPDIESAESVKTILLAQRVNKTFQHVIRRSVALQQALFFKPSHPTSKAEDVGWNPLLVHPAFDGTLKGILAMQENYVRLEAEKARVVTYFALPPVFSKNGEVNESWERMLLCQPPDVAGKLKTDVFLPVQWEMHPLTMDSRGTMGRLWSTVRKGKRPRTIGDRGAPRPEAEEVV